MEKMISELEKLCLINGISGDEGKVREYIISRIKDKAEITVDNLGNIIAFVKGEKKPEKKILVSAHMDEVGFIVNYINSDGTLKISAVGGIDSGVVYGRRVKIGDIYGVTGGTAIHNVSAEEREKKVPLNKITVDIGAKSKKEAEKYVSLGDSVCFDSEFLRFGDGMIKCKSIDDRAGCEIMLRLIEEGVKYDTYFTFVVQEEIGLRGATVASYTVNPDIAFVLEATTAGDIPPCENDEKVCEVRKGPVVSFMDRHTIYDKGLYNFAFETAKKNNIPCQTKTKIAGGNDAGAIHISRGGVRTCGISVPCRYLHSPACVINENDFFNTYRLVKKMLENVNTAIKTE